MQGLISYGLIFINNKEISTHSWHSIFEKRGQGVLLFLQHFFIKRILLLQAKSISSDGCWPLCVVPFVEVPEEVLPVTLAGALGHARDI